MAIALEELLVEFVLQVQDLLRERTLRDKQFAGRYGEVKRLSHTEEIFQLAKFHTLYVL